MSATPPSDPALNYYESNAERFAAETGGVDMTALYEPFLALLQPGARVLDAGCGSGRDARAFAAMGYRVTAFDASPAMAAVAERLTGSPVRVLRFQDVDYGPEFDGVWACASLLHVRREQVGDCLSRLARSLREGGVLFVSVKYGVADSEREGRPFTNFTPESLRLAVEGDAQFAVHRLWLTEDARPGRAGELWVNALGIKQRPLG